MSANSSLDRESFQQLLSAAFAVQESRMDAQSLSAIIEIQRVIAADAIEVDTIVPLIAERARRVADAAGIAIGLLEGNHLVYRAGIGSAAPYSGRQITATLSVAADTSSSREILRVENAQTDHRIEAAICRQFGAESLLIMPICDGKRVTGVLEVMFSEAHKFEDREVRAYRLMAGLLGEAVACASRTHENALPAQETIQAQIIQHPMPKFATLASDASFPQRVQARISLSAIYEAVSAAAADFAAFRRWPAAGAILKERISRLPLRTPQWSAAAAAAVALIIVAWSSYGDRHSVSLRNTLGTISQEAAATSAKPSSAESGATEQTAPVALAKKNFRSAFTRVRVSESEVDDVAEDVTVRHFTDPSRLKLSRAYNQVEFGKDVTVRYFAANPARVHPVANSVNETSDPAKSVIPKLAR